MDVITQLSGIEQIVWQIGCLDSEQSLSPLIISIVRIRCYVRQVRKRCGVNEEKRDSERFFDLLICLCFHRLCINRSGVGLIQSWVLV